MYNKSYQKFIDRKTYNEVREGLRRHIDCRDEAVKDGDILVLVNHKTGVDGKENGVVNKITCLVTAPGRTSIGFCVLDGDDIEVEKEVERTTSRKAFHWGCLAWWALIAVCVCDIAGRTMAAVSPLLVGAMLDQTSPWDVRLLAAGESMVFVFCLAAGLSHLVKFNRED
jgi:hypothetical protein